MSENDPAAMSCPECGQQNPADTRFCTSCGVRVVQRQVAAEPAEGAARPVGRRSRRKATAAPADSLARSAARHEFAKAKQVVKYLRTLFWVGALAAGVNVGLWHLATSIPQVRAEIGDLVFWVLSLLFWGQLGMMVSGALLVTRSPMVWSVVAASLHTLNTALVVYGGGAVAIAINGFFLLAYWAGVAQAARAQQLMADNPDLQVVRERIDRSRHVEGGIADHVKERRRRGRRDTWAGRLRLIGIAVGGAVVIGVVLFAMTRPPVVEEAVGAFATSWERGDREAIEAMFENGSHDSDARELRVDLERRGWHTSSPPLGSPTITDRGDVAAASFKVGAGEVVTSWQRHPTSRQWVLARVGLPAVVTGDFDVAEQRFRQAWKMRGLEALLGTLEEGMRARRGRQVEGVFGRRGWTAERPELGSLEARPLSEGRMRAEFELDGGLLTVGFEWWHPEWKVYALGLPREQ